MNSREPFHHNYYILIGTPRRKAEPRQASAKRQLLRSRKFKQKLPFCSKVPFGDAFPRVGLSPNCVQTFPELVCAELSLSKSSRRLVALVGANSHFVREKRSAMAVSQNKFAQLWPTFLSLRSCWQPPSGCAFGCSANAERKKSRVKMNAKRS